MRKLVETEYLAFPFRVGAGAGGVEVSTLEAHVREQIEQVLFTDPQERIFRPEFGAGVRALVFEPNSSSVRRLAHQRLIASLREALLGEVDPKTLDLEVDGENETLTLLVSYRLAAIDRPARHAFSLGAAATGSSGPDGGPGG